ncbi:allantoate deiminase [Neobacillus kokaensis]|uniref:allantoate deiminase n=1 Tax=Neobacillus kokaensis TaxID=2759023 RepID=UPI00174D8F04|nr:allantoate deiminase [Neobacillus kokaensis]
MRQLEKEIVEKLEWLGEFAKDPAGGISRLLYSKEWIDTQHALKCWMESEGFEAKFDEIGNLSGVIKGRNRNETILTGSHIDTVKNGGLYDGQLGVVAGVLAIKYLKQFYGQPLRNLEIVSLAEEEGSRFPYCFWGSRNIIGSVKRKDVERMADFNGVLFTEALTRAGFTFRDETIAPRKDLQAFVELHVEQGNVLETENTAIGIVQSIVGQRRFTVSVNGIANHAGTTPMGYRKDAVYAASQMIYETISLARELGDPLVVTVGKIEVTPNTVNVVPGNALFTVDVRHTDKNALKNFTELLYKKVAAVSKEHDVETGIEMWMDAEPVPMDPKIVGIIEKKCQELNVSYKLMHSGAGHDAQIFAPIVPTAMLFVPSRQGISHSPEEFTKPSDLALGVQTLIETLYELAYKE